MTSRSKNLVALREIHWKTLVLGESYPENFDSGNWTSAVGEKYPIDIVLGLQQLTNVYKVIVDVGEKQIPTFIDLAVGLGDVDEEVHYRNARNAQFQTPIRMSFHVRDAAGGRMESKVSYTDTIGQYIWLQVFAPIEHPSNPTHQINIRRVSVMGYPLDNEPKEDVNDKIEQQRSRPSTAYGIQPDRVGVIYNSHLLPEVHRFSHEGDGMSTNKEGIGGDSLSSIRTVKRALQSKLQLAQAAGKTVEATVCQRAIQRLSEYEARMEVLAKKRSEALTKKNYNEAERMTMLMDDCRDTAFRSVHVDLLLDRLTLRSIGVQSMWTESDQTPQSTQ